MELVWQWGIGVIISVQKIRSPFFDLFFQTVSFFGTLVFYILFLPLLYWCFDKKYASRIFILFLISSWFNTVLKDLINHPRPYILDASVKIGNTAGPGLPSGHAQQSLVVWGSLSLWLKKRFFTLFTVFFILLIAFSRIYLGVHFPTDIFGGWFAGALILLIIWPLSHRIEKFLSSVSPVILTAAAVIIPVMMSMIEASRYSVMTTGALSGFCAGIMIEKRLTDFLPAESFKAGLLRYISCAAILMIIFSAGDILIKKQAPCYFITVFIHSWIMSLWITAGAPLLIKKLRL